MKNSNVLLTLIFCIATILPFVSGAQWCLGRGYRNETDGVCSCIMGYHGINCEYKHCPFGSSWLSPPTESNLRNGETVECSNMGHCDWRTGKCICRDGYEGRACERLSCLGGKTVSHTYGNISSYYVGSPDSVWHPIAYAEPEIKTVCSGRGVCRSLRQMANEFNGISLIRPPNDYNVWDADKLQGCVCDPGYTGADCSRRTCPMGRDPLKVGVEYDREEVFVMNCHANGGYFTILALGQYTPPIPWDADIGYVKWALETLNNVGEVTVTIYSNDREADATICGASSVVKSTITFDSFVGARPPIFVTANTSATRQWRDADTALNIDGGTAVLRMETVHVLHCDVCVDCTGTIYFGYQNSLSEGIEVTNRGADVAITNAILNLQDLQDTRWTNLEVNVTIVGDGDALCHSGKATTTYISLYSSYGNIPFLTMVDGSRHSVLDNAAANLTWTTNAGNGTLYECSNQGTCDTTSGVCACAMNLAYGDIQYQVQSSDLNLGPGNRGDCGYVATPLPSCIVTGRDACNGHGTCSNATDTCVCNEGFTGMRCQYRECPKGRAFTDEPLLPGYAHQLVECSGMGVCDRTYGLCQCLSGFVGKACDIRDCVREAAGAGEPCHGHGACLSTAQYFKQYGYSYGNVMTGPVDFGENWDANNWYECSCSAKVSAGFDGDQRRPSVGPSTLVSGTVATSTPLPGWGNWDCSLRNCPKGDDVSRRNGYGGVPAIQRVVCQKDTATNTSDYFLLGILGATSERIYSWYRADDIKTALERPREVGNVTVWFPNAVNDNFTQACHYGFNLTDGGFLVRFDTEVGPIPLMTNLLDTNVTISHMQLGTSINEECGGSRMGFCDRLTGSCVCNGHQFSSDGNGNAGNLGECGYTVNIPLATDASKVFGSMKEEF